MIRHKTLDLRTPRWDRVDTRDLLERIKEDTRTGDDKWSITPWQKHWYGIARSYLAASTDGRIFVVYFYKT